MSATTGPILAIGGITMANQSLLNNRPIDWRVPIATGISAGMFALLERGWPRGASAIAYLALVTIIFVRIDPKTPAPMESLNSWLKGQRK